VTGTGLGLDILVILLEGVVHCPEGEERPPESEISAQYANIVDLASTMRHLRKKFVSSDPTNGQRPTLSLPGHAPTQPTPSEVFLPFSFVCLSSLLTTMGTMIEVSLWWA